MKNFRYDIHTKVVFGEGVLDAIGTEIKSLGGTRILLMYGKNSIKKNGLYDRIVQRLQAEGLLVVDLAGIKPNPSIESVREGQRLMKEHDINFVLAVGGGSVIDAAKAVASSKAYDGDPFEYISGKVTPPVSVPLGTVVTIAAAGSEMNSGAVISNEELGLKIPFFNPTARPVITFEDPTLMYTLPAYQTAAGATDIFVHLIEQYFDSHEDAGLTDRITEGMMRNVMNYARTAIDEPENYEARAQLMWTSSLALNDLLSYGKEIGDWMTHGIEHEVSAIYDITHGAGLAILVPHVLQKYLEKDIEHGLPLLKFVNFGKYVLGLEGDDETIARQVPTQLRTFFQSLDMPSTLAEEGVGTEHFRKMAEQAYVLGFNGRYHKVTIDDIVDIYTQSK